MRELRCHSSSSSPSTSTARRPAVPAPARQYPNLSDAHAHVERRHHITMRGSTTNDYSDWHQHTSAERQRNFLLPTSTSQPRPTTDRRQHIPTSWTPSAAAFDTAPQTGAVPGTTVTPRAAHVVCSLRAGGTEAGASSGSDIRSGSALRAHAHVHTTFIASHTKPSAPHFRRLPFAQHGSGTHHGLWGLLWGKTYR